ncbi:MAG: 16S rRNA (guanine(966)-N(2))-methyltransferase RsmD [Burkholderiaceae bacterium]|nr:16S rRNA (guanine(966)-N(2))-methyltransferase RsmD [Burkholderiaceae bacterium]
MTGRRAAAPRHAAPVSSRPREVRLIGGQWKRSKLPVADHPGLRPTPDRVRETLFNWLGQDLSGWRVLDAFAGSGALGFEAASRGAASVVLLERDPGLVRSLQGIKTRLTAEMVQVLPADALAWMGRQAPAAYELILLDPPFDAGLAQPALNAALPLLVSGGWIYLEAAQPLEALPPGLREHRRLRAGAVSAQLLQVD